jgi:hypothetical protein
MKRPSEKKRKLLVDVLGNHYRFEQGIENEKPVIYIFRLEPLGRCRMFLICARMRNRTLPDPKNEKAVRNFATSLEAWFARY